MNDRGVNFWRYCGNHFIKRLLIFSFSIFIRSEVSLIFAKNIEDPKRVTKDSA